MLLLPRLCRAALPGLVAAFAACSHAAASLGTPPAAGASDVYVEPDSGERHLRHIRQLTFGGNNAEVYFSPDGRRLIFQMARFARGLGFASEAAGLP